MSWSNRKLWRALQKNDIVFYMNTKERINNQGISTHYKELEANE